MDVVWTSKRCRVLTGIERLKELRCLNILMSEKLVGRKFFGCRVFLLQSRKFIPQNFLKIYHPLKLTSTKETEKHHLLFGGANSIS